MRRALPWLASERPSVYNAYQSTHGPRTEAAMAKADYVASFIGHHPGRAVFVGLYQNTGSRPVTQAQCRADPDYDALFTYGMSPWEVAGPAQTVLRFELLPLDMLKERAGRLVIGWPKPELAWYRWADRNSFPILAIVEDSLFSPPMPAWQEIVISWRELQVLPQAWRAALAHWRGIYLIYDCIDGKKYVGSACGSENIYGRWLNYAGSGHGGNKLLLMRDPVGFQFSILQRVSPDLPADEVIAIEASWKSRLHTYHPDGLNAN
jgi:hypothetical protein